MNSIYKSLERSSISGLDPHQIQILCEYLQGHCADSAVCEASRVLLQLVVFAKGDNVTKSIQELYLDIITGSGVEMDEFVSLGECIVKLLEMYGSYGAESLKGCDLELPFIDLECSPKKYSLAIRSLKALMDVLTFWSNVVALLYQDRTSPLSTTISNRIVSVFVDLTGMLSDFDATSTVVVTLSRPIEALLVHSNIVGVHFSANSEQNDSNSYFGCQILNGLISWCNYALTCSERLIAKSKSKESTSVAASPRSTAVSNSMYLQMARAMDNITTIAHMVAQCASQDPSIAADVEILLKHLVAILQAHSAQCEALRDDGNELDRLSARDSSSVTAGTSNNPIRSYSAESMIRLVVARLIRIAAALSSADGVSATAKVPVLSLFRKTCTDLPMVQEVAALLTQHLCMHSEIATELVRCWGTKHSTLHAPLALTEKNKNSSTAVREGVHFTPVSPLITGGGSKSVDVNAWSERESFSALAVEALMQKVLAGNDNILVHELTESALNVRLSADRDDVMSQLSKVIVPFEAWIVAQSVCPSFSAAASPECFGAMVSHRFEFLFKQLFSADLLDAGANTRSPPVVAAWALLQCVHRLSSVMCFDTLLTLAPASLWGLVAQAVELTKPTVIAALSVLSRGDVGSIVTNSATSGSAAPVSNGAGTFTGNIDVVERRLMGILINFSPSSMPAAVKSSTNSLMSVAAAAAKEAQPHDELVHNYLLVWLTIAALPLSAAHLDNNLKSAKDTTASEKETTSIGNKRSLHQDAESFDFFADNDSAEEDSNLRGSNNSSRKRLRKKNESVARSQSSDVVHPFVPSLSSPSSGVSNGSGDKKKVFVLFERQRQFVVDHTLQGCAVGVLLHQLSSTKYYDTTTSINTKSSVNGLCSAVEAILALLEHSTAVDADCWTVTLETSISQLLGLIMILLLQDLQLHAGDLSVAITYNNIVQHLLAPSSHLTLQDTLDKPEYIVFLVRLYEQAIAFRTASINTESNKSSGNVEGCERLVKHAATLLHYLSDRVMDATSQILNTNYFARSNSAEMDSEMQESEPYHDPVAINNAEENGLPNQRQKQTKCSVHLQLACVYRASLCVVSAYQDSVINGTVNNAVALPDPSTIDAQIIQLATHGLPDHTAHVRAAQCVTVSALSLLIDSTTSKASASSISTASAATTVPASLITLLTTTNMLMQDGFTHRAPGCKIASIGVCDLVRYASLLRPKIAVTALAGLCLSRGQNDEPLGADPFSAALLNLSQDGVLAMLLVSQAVQVVEEIVMPLLVFAAGKGGKSSGSNESNEDCVEYVDTLLHMFERYTAPYSSNVSYLDHIRGIVFAQLAHIHPATAKNIATLLFQHKISITCPTRYLLDEVPSTLHYLLLTPQMTAYNDPVAILSGALSTALTSVAKLFNVAVSESNASGDSCMSVVTFHHILLPIVWSIGGSTSTERVLGGTLWDHLRALQVLCAQANESTWTRRRGSSVPTSTAIDITVSEKLQADFLYILANLLLKDWNAQSQGYQEQSLKCFNALIRLLKQSDLTKFLPKIMTVVDSALSGASHRVRLAAVELTSALCPLLPVDVLGTHLSSLVVTLFPLLENEVESTDTSKSNSEGNDSGDISGEDRITSSAGVNTTTALSGTDLHHYGHLSRSFRPTLSTRRSPQQPEILVHLFETANTALLNNKYISKTKRIAVDIIKKLFIERREDIQPFVKSVAYIPNIKELKSVYELHQLEVRAMSLEQSLLLLCEMLSHSSAHVRLVAVNRLTIVCKESKAQINHILSLTTDSTTATALQHIVSTVLQALLQLCAVESEKRVIIACSKCLGELGAIDPSRVSVKLAKNTHSTTISSTDASPEQKLRDSFPWYIPPRDLGVYLLEHHLVPGLRSATGSALQDKFGYAIQVILKQIAEVLSSNPTEGEEGSNNASMAMDVDNVTTTSSNKSNMPEALKTLLQSKNLLDVTEPFWNTSYTMDEKYAVRSPPIYTAHMSFYRWLPLFTRFLIFNTKGALSAIFMACRGVVRIRTELCQYLLPLLIYDVLTTNDRANSITAEDPNGSAPHTRKFLNLIITELSLVLRGANHNATTNHSTNNSNIHHSSTLISPTPSTHLTTTTNSTTTSNAHSQSDHMCIQSIFTLLDTLQTWISRCTHKEGLSYVRTVQNGRTAIITPKMACKYGFDTNGMECIKMLIDAVPMELLSTAALNIKAYARALRYLETHARVVHRVETFGIYAYARKSAPNDYFIQSAERAIDQYQAERRKGASSAVSNDVNKGSILCSDHAGGMLPVLCASQLDSFMTIFAHLQDPDSLQGALVLNHIHQYTPSMWHRILELELTDDWLGALLEYGLIHNSQSFSNSLHSYITSSASGNRSGDEYTTSQTTLSNPANVNRKLVRQVTNKSITSNSSSGSIAEMDIETHNAENTASDTNSSASHSNADGSVLMPLQEIVELERRKLRCMVELGHYEAVIDQSTAMSSRLKEMEHALLPLGTEAAWRLMRWDDLDSFLSKYDTPTTTANKSSALKLPVLEEDRFQLSVGKLLLSLQKKDRFTFDSVMDSARAQTMASLSAASMESYGRAYPALTQLHALHELQTGFDLLRLSPADSAVPSLVTHTTSRSTSVTGRESNTTTSPVQALHWDERLYHMAPSVPQRSTVLAVRRCILGICQLPHLVAQNWLTLSNSMRQLGKFDSARLAVRSAQNYGLDAESELLQECRIYRDSGEVSRALMMLEPVEVDLSAIEKALLILQAADSATIPSSKSKKLPAYLETEQKRRILAERIHLATQLMVDSKQKQGNSIINRYKTVISLHPQWPEAHFDLAKYHEFLYHDVKTKQVQTILDLQALYELNPGALTTPATSTASVTNPARTPPLSLLQVKQQQYNQECLVLCNHLQQALEAYGKCLVLGSELAMQVLPRMLTLWLAFTALVDPVNSTDTDAPSRAGTSTSVTSTTSSRTRVEPSILVTAQAKANQIMTRICTDVPASTWYMCMSQLVSRVLHRNDETVKVIIAILLKILATFPKQGIWHMASLMFSLNADRKKIAKKLLQDTYKALNSVKSVDAVMLVDSQKICQNLISLASHQCKERRIRWKMNPEVCLENFLVPSQAVLYHTNPLSMLNVSDANTVTGGGANSTGYYGTDQMFLSTFNEIVDVASSKAKPKTISFRTVCGKTVKFLCKQEKDGDLRKDARLMEFNTTVNRLLTEDPEGHKRNLRLRTYAVVCLNEECGILEWVNNTDCLRALIHKAHLYWQDVFPVLSYKEIADPIVEIQTKSDDDLTRMMVAYSALLKKNEYKPCFHRWFLEQFPDPTAWQEARANFVHSAAVWSAVGHVIGLGDRHTENILIDVTNGEMVHVDFDCLFDKGLGLARPEIVPFRLTPNLVDAMGVTGVEGAYRRTLEVTLSVLRENKDTLLSVLEPFLRDPTVSWGRSGRAQRSMEASAAASTTTTTGGKAGRDHENKEAREMLMKISQRLDGVYNIQHPNRERLLRAAHKPVKGIGVSKEEMLPLSVQGQVHRLIDEATAPENLVQMYIGWQPWV